MKFPRFRGKKRDIETDIARVVPIRNAVATALRESESELEHLTTRLKQANTEAAFLFGNDIQSDTRDDPAHDAWLREAETFLVRGERRANYLQRQVTILRDVAKNLERIVTPVTPILD